MELDAEHIVRPVSNPHNDAIFSPRRDLETIRKARPVDDQRMISRRFERILEARQDSASSMMDPGCLPVHELVRTPHGSSECLPDRLMTQTDAQDRDLPRELPNDRH